MEWKRDSVDQSPSWYDHTSGAGAEQTVPLYEEAGSAQRGSALAALRLLTSYNHFLVPPDVHNVVGPLLAALPPAAPCLPPYCQHLPLRSPPMLSTCEEIRRRGEKRPIPAELKDEKYFERRRRNNQAAKKSRDARRIREDQVAWRAYILEQENSSLRAHVATLRQEALALRGLLAARDHPAAAPVAAAAAAAAAAAPSSTTPD